MNWYRKAQEELTAVAAAVRAQQSFSINRLESLRDGLVSALKRSDDLLVYALSGPPGSPLITNLINVGILGTKVGIGLGYYGEELERLALAGLVHDIGLFAVPQSLVTTAGRLTQEERMVIEQHPELGCRLIRTMGPQYDWLAQIVRQTHERFNGMGYPNRLKGGHVGDMARIIGVVDVFDALVSERPYRRRLIPYQAVKELLSAERTAFPREILKALVEQLTVYPLGTTVRLTTGEIAQVSRVNHRYPLRPVVKMSGSKVGEEAGGRLIDLSLTPLLSILDTVAPPSVDHEMPSRSSAEPDTASSCGAPSDQFTSLLESLDAIVSAIQGVVETRTDMPRQHKARSLEGAGAAEAVHPAPETGGTTFQKEMVGLFALEAHEWLRQIQTALKKLGTGAEGVLRSKLYGFILNGITNLGRSASTVHLFDIEAMASNLLPILRDVGRTESQWTVETLRPLHHGLDRITAAVRRLAEDSVDVGRPVEQRGDGNPLGGEDVARSGNLSPGAQLRPDSPKPVEPTMPLLKALKALQQARARSMQPARDVLESVIERAQHEAGEGQDEISVEAIKRILLDLDRMDEEFLRDIHGRVPTIADRIAQLREHGKPDDVSMAEPDPMFVNIDALEHVAKRIDAKTMMMFLQGIKSFLTVAIHGQDQALPERLQAVEERVRRLIPMAEQWVTLGRLERASIEEILPA